MLRSALSLLSLGLVSGLLAPQAATAATWSIEADCQRGDWWVDVELAGFGPIDASCDDGGETRLSIDVGVPRPTRARIAAISSLGTVCEGPETNGTKLTLKCGSEIEDATGFEVEEELEVEVELEEPDEVEEAADE